MLPRSARVASIAALAALSLAQSACMVTVDAGRYSARDEKRWTVSGTPDLTLVTFDGSIEVRSWDKAEILVEIEKRASDKTQADAIEISASQSGSTISLEARKPPARESLYGLKVSPSAKIIATVPRRCNLVARTGDGSITIERLEGRVEMNSGDGSLRASEIAGSIRAHTGDGALTFEDVDGSVDLDTGDGNGEVNGRLSALRVRTGDGAISVRAESGSAMAGEWEVRTGDGNLRVEVPEGFAANLDASTGDGRVRVEGLGAPDGSEEKEDGHDSIRRPLGPGGNLLRIRTGSGSVTIRKL
jgi:hypothetical protein